MSKSKASISSLKDKMYTIKDIERNVRSIIFAGVTAKILPQRISEAVSDVKVTDGDM